MHRLIGRRNFLKGAGALVALGAVDACRFLPGASRTGGRLDLQLPPLWSVKMRIGEGGSAVLREKRTQSFVVVPPPKSAVREAEISIELHDTENRLRGLLYHRAKMVD